MPPERAWPRAAVVGTGSSGGGSDGSRSGGSRAPLFLRSALRSEREPALCQAGAVDATVGEGAVAHAEFLAVLPIGTTSCLRCVQAGVRAAEGVRHGLM